MKKNTKKSPTEYMLDRFKSYVDSKYDKMLVKDSIGIGVEMRSLKLKAYVQALYSMVEDNKDVTIKTDLKGYSIVSDNTLIKTFGFDDVDVITTEAKLKFSFLVDWGYLNSKIEKVKMDQQCMLIAL